jgi:hypothetical protein
MSVWPLDLHLAPVYLKWANESFTHGHDSDGMQYFQAAEWAQKSLANLVYEQMSKIKNCPQGDPEYGRKCFHTVVPLSSLPYQKCLAIEKVLEQIGPSDTERRGAPNELRMRASEVYRHLGIILGRPSNDVEYGRHAFYGLHGKSSTMEERLLAAQHYAAEARALTWLTDGKEIRLIKRADGGLEFIIIDDLTGDVHCTPVDMKNRGIDDAISRWSSYALTSDSESVIPSSLRSCSELPAPVIDTLQLFWQGPELVWRIYHTASKTLSFIPADYKTKGFRAELLLADDRVAFLRDFNFRYRLNDCSKLLSVSIHKKIFQSQLSSNVLINRDVWAVTLISGGPSSRSWASRMANFGHAMIAYEGVENGDPFLKRVHLTTIPEDPSHPTKRSDEARIEFRDDLLRLDCLRTPTWPRAKEQVDSMIQWCQLKNRTPIPFNHGGQWWSNSSFLSAVVSLAVNDDSSPAIRDERNNLITIGHTQIQIRYNCLTWSITALRMAGIDLPEPKGLVAEPIAYIESIVKEPEVVRFS